MFQETSRHANAMSHVAHMDVRIPLCGMTPSCAWHSLDMVCGAIHACVHACVWHHSTIWPFSETCVMLPVGLLQNTFSATMTVSIENATPMKSTKSRNSHSSVEIQSKPKSQFEFVQWDTEEFEFHDLADVGCVCKQSYVGVVLNPCDITPHDCFYAEHVLCKYATIATRRTVPKGACRICSLFCDTTPHDTQIIL